MTTQVVFNIDKNLKKKAMLKSKKMGLPFSFVLNNAVKRFVNEKVEVSFVEEKFNEKTRNELDKIWKDINKGKNISPAFTSIKKAMKYLKSSENIFS